MNRPTRWKHALSCFHDSALCSSQNGYAVVTITRSYPSSRTISWPPCPPNFILLGIVYFVLGYLLFAVLSVAVGAISPNSREGQSLAALYTLMSFVPLWTASPLMLAPRSPLWIVLSIFPITAPVQTMLRLGLMEIPAWQIAASTIVMTASIVGGLSLAARIFRAHLLKTGSRPSLVEIIRNLRDRCFFAQPA